MATKTNPAVQGAAKTSNPIIHVTYEAGDLSGIEVQGGGGKELVPVTSELRQQLQATVQVATTAIATETAAYPGVPSVLIMRLRDIAIAKTHHPATLAYKAGMPHAGHGPLNEMLVAANTVSVAQLSEVIAHNNTKTIRANLSAVAEFETWGVQRRLPKSFRGKDIADVYRELIARQRRLMVRLFSHRGEDTTMQVVEHMVVLLDSLGISFNIVEQRVGPPLYFLQLDDAFTVDAFKRIIHYQGIRHVLPEPHVIPTVTAAPATVAVIAPRFTARPPDATLPLVAVFDTGVAPGFAPLTPWVASRDTYVLAPDTNFEHGTSVSSLIIDSAGLNTGHSQFPVAPCRIHDVCALETGGARVGDLILRLRDAVRKRPDVKVWNLSLGAGMVSDDEFSDFGRELDALSDTHDVLFVVAAGNYVDLPRRGWPVADPYLDDRISSPADSVRALTVGSVAHLDNPTSLVRSGEPAPYSRRGPGPVFTPKPDIVHLGGNNDTNLNATDVGVCTLSPAGFVATCGTSYAAPIAASLAAHTWQGLMNAGHQHPLMVTPTMVKALMVHSAQLNSPDRSPVDRRYYGTGLPGNTTSVLYDTDSSFTMLFELDIADTTKWRKAPFPIPASLIHNGKLRGEIIITAAYAPPVNAAYGAEYVRANVDVGFGTLTPNSKGALQFHGAVPAEGELGTTGFEQAQVEHGGKWSSIKTYRRAFTQGKSGDVWALQATMLRRAFEPPLAQPLRVVIIVTLRALDGNPNVYNDGQRALTGTNWVTQNLSTRIQVQV